MILRLRHHTYGTCFCFSSLLFNMNMACLMHLFVCIYSQKRRFLMAMRRNALVQWKNWTERSLLRWVTMTATVTVNLNRNSNVCEWVICLYTFSSSRLPLWSTVNVYLVQCSAILWCNEVMLLWLIVGNFLYPLKVQKKNYRQEKKRAAKELFSALKDPTVVIMSNWLKVHQN